MAILSPASGSTYAAFPAIHGTVQDNLLLVLRVSVRIRAVDLPGGVSGWWDGTAFRPSPTDLPAIFGSGVWQLDPAVSRPPMSCGQSYEVTATALDGGLLSGSTTATFNASSAAPTVQITSHSQDQSVGSLPAIRGVVTSASAPLGGVAFAIRGFDQQGYALGWWNGAAFQPAFTSLPCVYGGAGENPLSLSWNNDPTIPLPCVAPGDVYELQAWAWSTTSCTNSASVTVHVQISEMHSTPSANGPVYALAVQADGKFLAGGDFTTLDGWGRNSVGRGLPAGGVDTFFNAAIEPDPWNGDDVVCLAVQTDGRILVGGQYFTFGWSQEPYLARVYSDGWLDWSFSALLNAPVRALAVQPDGKIVVAGESPSARIRRYHSDGSLDTAFAPSAGSQVNCVAVQPDGKILAGGLFTTLNGQSRNYLGRLHPDGTLDDSFTPDANAEVHTLLVQPDGKILVGGDFTTIGGQSHARLARLEAGGAVESWFNPGLGANGRVETIALQADGRIVVGGAFSQLHGQSREGLGRLLSDGSLDSSFDPVGTYATVHALALQPDGRLIVGGSFSQLAGIPANNLGRLETLGRAPQCLSRSGNRITWQRGGSSPEVWRTTFEVSADGVNWTVLGAGTRIAGGWEIAGDSVPANANLRARGWATGGRGNGSTWFVESLIAPPIISIQPVSQTLCSGPGQGATFIVAAIGSGPFTYRWRKDGAFLTDGQFGNTYIQGVTTPTLQLSGLGAGAAGAYDAVVANSLGSTVSAAATLTIVGPPVIVTQPTSATARPGENATLTVLANYPSLLNYQWRKEGLLLDGQTNAWLSLPNLQRAHAGQYDVVLASSCGRVTSTVARLTVNLALADAFNPQFSQSVLALVPQVDGRVLVGGYSGMLGPGNPSAFARLSRGGVIEPAFVPDADGYPLCLALQDEGGAWAGGSLWPPDASDNMLVRLNADGSLGTALALQPNPSGASIVNCLARQADGKLLVGGQFSALGGKPRLNLARLNADGTVDDEFNPEAEDWGVHALAVQPDGRILVGGGFHRLAGQDCVSLGRLHPNGTFDSSFLNANTDANNFVHCLAVQPDGRILVGGMLSSWNGVSRTNLLRVDANGQLDLNFNPVVTGHLLYHWEAATALALQADGKILVAGQFLTVGGLPRHHLARLHPDGTPDLLFAPDPDDWVKSVALESGGGVLVSGFFSDISGQPRGAVARLANPDPATNELTFTPSAITWRRGGSTPEVWRAAFETSADGVNWTPLGAGTRIAGGWQLTGLSLAAGSRVRARGFVGGSGGSDYFVESQAGAILAPRLNGAALGPAGFRFQFQGLPGIRYYVEFRTNLTGGAWTELEQRMGSGAVEAVTDPSALTGQRFYRLRAVPEP